MEVIEPIWVVEEEEAAASSMWAASDVADGVEMVVLDAVGRMVANVELSVTELITGMLLMSVASADPVTVSIPGMSMVDDSDKIVAWQLGK